jgi:16S rRNA A1518/A1519 N6-dimethyltransferase RsmA/KsgA/DIM1 with predicted DNA glycosylase/AP lyase activity
VIRTAFHQRRKTLLNSLRPLWEVSPPARAALERVVDLSRRAEELVVDDFIAIARAIGEAAA